MHLAGKFPDAPEQLWQRNINRIFQMVLTPFRGGSHIHDNRALRRLQRGEEIVSFRLGNRFGLVKVISRDKTRDLIKPNTRQLNPSLLGIGLVLPHQCDRQIGLRGSGYLFLSLSREELHIKESRRAVVRPLPMHRFAGGL